MELSTKRKIIVVVILVLVLSLLVLTFLDKIRLQAF